MAQAPCSDAGLALTNSIGTSVALQKYHESTISVASERPTINEVCKGVHGLKHTLS
jgi:hypothetical protein